MATRAGWNEDRRRIYEPPDVCRGNGCSAAAHEGGRCERHWEELLDVTMKRAVRPYEDASSFYVGRTNFPEARLLEHFLKTDGDLRRMAVLHWSACQKETAALEIRLIKRFEPGTNRLKGRNADPGSGGGFSGSWNCVYVAWVPRARDRSIKPNEFREVSSLDANVRMWPERLADASLLRFKGTPAAARQLLRLE